MHAVVDPVLLHPPAEKLHDWVSEIEACQRVLDAGAFTASCPLTLNHVALSEWYARRDDIESVLAVEGSPLDHSELIRVLEPLRGRLIDSALPAGVEALIDEPRASPEYLASLLSVDERACFVEHLGQAALLRDLESELTAVLSPNESWAEFDADVSITATLLLLVGVDAGRRVDPESERPIREILRRWTGASAALTALADHPCALIDHPELGVRATYAALEGDPWALNFQVSSGFSSTLREYGYAAASGRTATCFRTMALISAGRASELGGLEAHPQRKGPGPNEPAVEDADGRTLYRGYLANKSPDAHRLFWWSGREPEFVGIAGHEAPPPS